MKLSTPREAAVFIVQLALSPFCWRQVALPQQYLKRGRVAIRTTCKGGAMIKAREQVCDSVVENVEQRGRELARRYHVPFEDLFVRYALSSVGDGMLVVQIRHAGHILDKVTIKCGEWEKQPVASWADGRGGPSALSG
jgi:hypothetical protein